MVALRLSAPGVKRNWIGHLETSSLGHCFKQVRGKDEKRKSPAFTWMIYGILAVAFYVSSVGPVWAVIVAGAPDDGFIVRCHKGFYWRLYAITASFHFTGNPWINNYCLWWYDFVHD